MITGIHHIALILSSEETLEFYKCLGFTESFRKPRENDTIVLLDGYGIQLEVFIDIRHPKRPEGLNEPLGIRHLALKVDAPLEEIIDKIKEIILQKQTPELLEPQEGLNTSSFMTDWLGSRFVFIKDPGGNTLELHE